MGQKNPSDNNGTELYLQARKLANLRTTSSHKIQRKKTENHNPWGLTSDSALIQVQPRIVKSRINKPRPE